MIEITCRRCGIGTFKGTPSALKRDGTAYVHSNIGVCNVVDKWRADRVGELQKRARHPRYWRFWLIAFAKRFARKVRSWV